MKMLRLFIHAKLVGDAAPVNLSKEIMNIWFRWLTHKKVEEHWW